MSLERREGGTFRPVEITLREEIDYLYPDDVLPVIVRHLKRLGLYREDLLICGYARPFDADDSFEASRRSFFAITLEEYAQKLENHDDWTPLAYAEYHAHEQQAQAVLDIYDPEQTISGYDYQYEVQEGCDLDSVRVASFILELQGI